MILGLNAQVISEFNLPIQNFLKRDEQISEFILSFDGNNLYLELLFAPVSENGVTYSPTRSDIIFTSITAPTKIVPLRLGIKGQFYKIISVDPKRQFLLLAEKDNTQYDSLIIVNINDGELVKEMPLRGSWYLFPYCLKDCTKTAVETDSVPSELLIWSWEDMKLTSYPRDQLGTVLGTDNVQNGFLCLWNGYVKTGILGVTLYK
jgi:hypothetical protein